MNRVAALVSREEYGQALLRLWVLAGQRTAGTSRLNTWELQRNAKAFPTQVEQFRRRLQEDAQLTASEIDAAPLAFVTALDEALTLDEQSLPTFEMKFEEEGAGYWLTRIEMASTRQVPLARQAGNREAWFKRHSIIPARTTHGIEVRVTVASGRLAQCLGALIAGDWVTLRGWVGHFGDAARLEWDTSPAGRFRLRRIHPADTRNDSIRESLKHASECGSEVVVLPEFTVDLDGRKVAADWMVTHPEHTFLLVVAGSFHEDTPEGCYNTAELWNHLAEPILVHRKLRLFGAAEGLAEDVKEGGRIEVLVSPIGTLTLLICKDFMDGHQSVATLLQEVPVDWVLVPSYGDERTVKGHRSRAEQLAKVGPGTSSFVANQRNVEMSPGVALPGFAMGASDATCQDVGEMGGPVRIDVPIQPADGPSPRPGRLKRVM